MIRPSRLLMLIPLFFSLGFSHSIAADIELLHPKPLTLTEMEKGRCNILLSGPIAKGDMARLDAFWEDRKTEFLDGWGWGLGWSVCLNSTGGDYLEGVKLAELFSKNGFGTVVPDGGQCLSACAIAFMGGTYQDEGSTHTFRTLHVNGQLGFHRPYLNLPEGDYGKSTVISAYTTAVIAIKRFLRFAITGPYENYLISQRVKTSLIEEFLGFDRNAMLYIDNLDKAGRWEIGLHGFRPRAITKNGLKLACINMHFWHRMDQSAIPQGPNKEGIPDQIEEMRKDAILTGQKRNQRSNQYVFALTYGMSGTLECKIQQMASGAAFVTGDRGTPPFAIMDPAIKIRDLR